MLFTVILLYYQRYACFFLKATTPRHIFSVSFLSVCSFTTINGRNFLVFSIFYTISDNIKEMYIMCLKVICEKKKHTCTNDR